MSHGVIAGYASGSNGHRIEIAIVFGAVTLGCGGCAFVGSAAMQQDPRLNPMREFGRAVDNAIGNAQDRARGAFNAADVAVRGRSLTGGEMRMIQDMFGTSRGFGRARVFPRNF